MIVNEPSAREIAPFLEDPSRCCSMDTKAPATGSPVIVLTKPLMLFCANVIPAEIISRDITRNAFLYIIHAMF